MSDKKWALIVSPTQPAQEAAEKLKPLIDWVPVEEADQAVVLGGDGFMLQTLHQMLNRRKIMPVYGMNLGTVGFLMNNWHMEDLEKRLRKARAFKVKPLKMEVETISGAKFTLPAINEVSLLRETRQTAKLEIEINGRIMMEELVCDGVLIATPAGSTAYNLQSPGADTDQPIPAETLERRDFARQDGNHHPGAEPRKTARQRRWRPTGSSRCQLRQSRDRPRSGADNAV